MVSHHIETHGFSISKRRDDCSGARGGIICISEFEVPSARTEKSAGGGTS